MSRRPSARRAVPAVARSVEIAEPRAMMSGNVVAEITGGVLRITADNATNHFDVLFTQSGDVLITGDATRINRSLEPVILDVPEGGLTGIDVRLGRGGDRVSFKTEGFGGEVPVDATVIDGDVTVHAGHGRDRVWLEGLEVTGDLRVDGGPSNDVLAVKDVTAANMTVIGARGLDHIGLSDASADGDVTVYGSRDADRISALGVVSGGVTRLQGGDGPDWVVGDVDAVANGHRGANFVRTQVTTPLDRSLAAVVIDAVNDAAGEEVRPTLAAPDLSAFPDGTDLGAIDPSHAFTRDFTQTPSGMYYRIIGGTRGVARPTVDSEVTVHYEGQLLNGDVFDSSYDRASASTFRLQNVILGWQGAVPMLEPGQKMQVFIPPNLAYGSRGQGSIPPNAWLFFSIELIRFRD